MSAPRPTVHDRAGAIVLDAHDLRSALAAQDDPRAADALQSLIARARGLATKLDVSETRPAAAVPLPAERREPWLRRRDACAHAGISRSTLIRWEAEGLPVHKPNRICLYRLSELDAFITARGAAA